MAEVTGYRRGRGGRGGRGRNLSIHCGTLRAGRSRMVAAATWP